ncbi:hypothetical protein BIS06_17620, partial [Halomonas sp. BBD48]|nr:hypothetical protein [Halomonas sp. BBD48]
PKQGHDQAMAEQKADFAYEKDRQCCRQAAQGFVSLFTKHKNAIAGSLAGIHRKVYSPPKRLSKFGKKISQLFRLCTETVDKAVQGCCAIPA